MRGYGSVHNPNATVTTRRTQPYRLRLTTTERKVIHSITAIEGFIATAFEGTVDIWLGETEPDSFPHFRFLPGEGSRSIWLPEGVYTFTIAPGGTSTLRAAFVLLGGSD